MILFLFLPKRWGVAIVGRDVVCGARGIQPFGPGPSGPRQCTWRQVVNLPFGPGKYVFFLFIRDVFIFFN